MSEGPVPQLRRRTASGELYTRPATIEALLADLRALSRDQLVARASISKRSDARYVPSECLVHFIRASRADNNEAWFERLYRILAERVLRSLPKADRPGRQRSLTQERIRDQVFGRFVELLAADRHEYLERLDFFEIHFDGALANLRRDAQKRAWRDENRSVPLEFDEESGELSPEVEAAAGSYDPFKDFDEADYRLRLQAAIDSLPPEQIRIVHMLRQGIPIDSKEADVLTIAKALGRSEKTIRTHRDKAFAALRRAMAEDTAP